MSTLSFKVVSILNMHMFYLSVKCLSPLNKTSNKDHSASYFGFCYSGPFGGLKLLFAANY